MAAEEIKYIIPSDKILEMVKDILNQPLKLTVSLGDNIIVEYIVAKDSQGDVFLNEVEK